MTEEKTSNEHRKTERTPPAEETRLATWRFALGSALVGIWALVLAVFGIDRAFDLGWFPTKLERMLLADVKRLTAEDLKARERAENELFSYHGFSVPVLIKGMKSGDAAQKEACAKCLQRIAEYYYGAKPNYGADAQKWQEWWDKIDRWMTELIDREADEQQRALQEETPH